MKASTILDQIDLGSMALPEFQRGYVWNRNQVRGLMHSLYRRYPVGGLLVWKTKIETTQTRGGNEPATGTVDLLLDGQQRVTSLYGIIRGVSPPFFEGNYSAFTGLYFNLEEEVFEFYASVRMQGNPLWISVTELMQAGLAETFQHIQKIPELDSDTQNKYINRLNDITGIKEIDLHVEQVTGEDKTVDVVVDIFNRVNSGGTKLSKGDLALARVCAAWPEARDELNARLRRWREAGFHFKMDWLLRNINTVITGEALFSALKDVDTAEFKSGLEEAEKCIDSLLNTISARLGLDHDRVLGGRYAFPVMSRYLSQRDGKLDHVERDRLLYWYVHSFLWGRFTGSTETAVNRDLSLIEDPDGALDRLIEQLRQNRGDLRIHAGDFSGWSLGARFYPLLYLLNRVWGARDWGTGNELSGHLLGKFSSLELHHIFPKSYLYKHGYNRPEVNALANFSFLTQETNQEISNRPPEDYFEEIMERDPRALESQWIPMERDLWRVENYRDFLAARQELLADAANRFLESLLHGEVPEKEAGEDVTQRIASELPGGIADDEEERIRECGQWAEENGLPEPEREYELVDEVTGEQLAVLDLAWPDGLQTRLSEPVAVLLDEPHEVEDAARSAGYRFFRSVEEFMHYARS